MYVTGTLGNQHAFFKDAYYLPLRLRKTQKPKKLDEGNGEFESILQESAPTYGAENQKITANLSLAARAYLAAIGIENPDLDAETASMLWMHTLSIGYSRDYFGENVDGIRQDWPRIPLPNSKAALVASAEYGRKVAALLDTGTPLAGVDAGRIRKELVRVAVVTRLSTDTLNLSLTAGWGHAGKGGVTMPGKGKLALRDYAGEEAPALEARHQLGSSTRDVYLNDGACWKNIPVNVWDYTIGGYQVLKKWLSYREFELLGRALTADEAREVTHNARRIAALLMLQPELDRNYAEVKAAAFSWGDLVKEP